MNFIELVPNKSFGYLKLNDNIENYFDHQYVYHRKKPNDKFMEDYYVFSKDCLVAFVNRKNLITSINCDGECYWKSYNLYKLPFVKFKELAKVEPDDYEKIYILSNPNRGQNQYVYTFEDLGLQIWVWRNKIVTISCTNFD